MQTLYELAELLRCLKDVAAQLRSIVAELSADSDDDMGSETEEDTEKDIKYQKCELKD